MTAVRRFWPPLSWMAVIFIFSTGLFGGSQTGSVIEAILAILYPQASPELVDTTNFIVRKAGHLTEYAVLAVLWLRSIKGERPDASTYEYASAFCICALYAASDEFHQGFVPGRTASLMDVMIDSAGATAALLVIRAKKQAHTKGARQ